MKRDRLLNEEHSLSLEEIKDIELSLAKEIRDFCEEHNIAYYLIYGTLLGAIRHRGFIPWDDDVDFGMPRADYDRFIRSFHVNGLTLFKVGDKGYRYPFCKVSANNTILIEEEMKAKTPFGVYVDVFPLDYIPSKAKKRKKYFKQIARLRRCLSIKNTHAIKKGRHFRNFVVIIGKIVLSVFPVSFFCKKLDKVSRNRDILSDLMGDTVWGDGLKEVMDVNVFSESIDVAFENKFFKAPKGYDVYLTSIYGDYMTPPPPEQQVSNHKMRAYYIK